MDHDSFFDLALVALWLVISWWGLGRLLSAVDGAGGWLWVAIAKIREPEAFEAIAGLSDAERQEMLYDLQGRAIGAKIRAFNRGELPKAEMDATRERLRKAGF